MNRTVLVTGARGKTGRHVVELLSAEPGVRVRAGGRDLASLAAAGAEPVAFDWSEPAGWAAAVAGADAVYLVRPDREDAPELMEAFVDAAAGAHVVALSEQTADTLARDHWAVRAEAAVTSRARAWTLLRPSWFMQVLDDERFFLASIRDDDELAMPTGGRGMAWIDARDIAAVAVAALLDEEHHAGRTWTLTGPEVIALDGVAAALASVTGRPVRALDIGIPEAVAGVPPWEAWLFADVYERVRAGGYAIVTGDVEAVTGRPARRLEAFVSERAAAWSS